MQRTVAAARAEEDSVGRMLASHLGGRATDLPVVRSAWPGYDRVNVQVGLEAWLGAPGRTHRLVGLTQYRHREFGLADLLRGGERWGPRIGSVETEALPAGPGGLTRPCTQCGIYLVADSGSAAAVLLRGPEEHGRGAVTVEVASAAGELAQQAVNEIRRLALEHNVFRGHVIAFGGEVFDRDEGGLLSFLDRPDIGREQVILPAPVLDGIERQVLGVARHAARLRASGQHLRRGVLLYGPAGTGQHCAFLSLG